MSAPAQINALKATDFPKGIQTKADVDKLFQLLNPFFAALAVISAHGASLADNLAVQTASFSFTCAAPFKPLIVRMQSGKKPRLVLCSAYNESSQGVQSTWNPSWTHLGQSGDVNQLRVDDLPGLTVGVKYSVTVFIFF